MYFQPGLSNLLLFGWWRTMQLALREMPARRVGPGLLLARKNRSLASRTSGALSGDILKTMPFEPNATPVFQIKREMGSLGRGVRPVEHM